MYHVYNPLRDVSDASGATCDYVGPGGRVCVSLHVLIGDTAACYRTNRG